VRTEFAEAAVRATGVWRADPRQAGRAVLVDIDGVVADTSARQHLLSGAGGRRDWDAFFAAARDDAPLTAVPSMLASLDAAVAVVLLSGRPSWLVDDTVDWLARHGVRWDLLLVRRTNDRSRAGAFKGRVATDLQAVGFVLELAIDDDADVVVTYRDLGIPTLHPHPDQPRRPVSRGSSRTGAESPDRSPSAG
jgi:hypothetical protein